MENLNQGGFKAQSRARKAPAEGWTNFEPVLQSVQGKLGLDWTFYYECIEAITKAFVDKQDAAPW